MTNYFMVAGSRHWDLDPGIVLDTMLVHCDGGETMLDGACPTGLDPIAYKIWTEIFGFPSQRFPADWQQFGKRAAFLRDMQMIGKRPKFLLAFPLSGEENKGTKLAIKLARDADIRVIEVPGG
jgi:hypothetical protein